MNTIRESFGREMRWRRTRLLPAAFELRADDSVVATLEWQALFSRSASATSATGRWRFRRPALFSLAVDIEDAESGERLASYAPAPLRGTLRFADGRTFRIGRDHLFGPLKTWREDGSELLSYARRLTIRGGGPMRIEAAAAAEPGLDVLVTFAFYVLTLRRRRAARSSGGG